MLANLKWWYKTQGICVPDQTPFSALIKKKTN